MINSKWNFLTATFKIFRSQSRADDDRTLDSYDKGKSKFSEVEDGLQGEHKLKGTELSDKEHKVKMKGKLFNKKKKLTIEEYKIRATLKIEKERVQQKSEELRLRALELKLKGDELKLKEMEMNKINYLTNIEEEKLKCFRDISSSLKELLERAKTGNLRFHNGI